MTENELLATLVEYYLQADIPTSKINAHLYDLHLKLLNEIYRDKEGLFILHSGERVEAFDVSKLRSSLEITSDSVPEHLSSGDIERIVRLTLEKINTCQEKLKQCHEKIIPARVIRHFVGEAIEELGFQSMAIAYKKTRKDELSTRFL